MIKDQQFEIERSDDEVDEPRRVNREFNYTLFKTYNAEGGIDSTGKPLRGENGQILSIEYIRMARAKALKAHRRYRSEHG